MIKGLPEALEKGVACSNYIDPEHTWETIKNFKGGNALFTQPTTPIKCGELHKNCISRSGLFLQKKVAR